MPSVTSSSKLGGVKMGGIAKALAAPKIRTASATSLGTKPFGQSTSGSPDVLGPLRRARQVLAGEPSAIKPKPFKGGY